MKLGTKFIHAGQQPDPATGAIMTPVYQTSTFVQGSPGIHKGYEYSRTGNPTRHALEAALAAAENGDYGLCFGSGSAATDAVIKLLQPGDEVVAADDMYGGTYRLFTKVFQKFGILFKFINMQNIDELKNGISDKTKLVWSETPTNPMMKVTDIAAVSGVCKEKGILLAVDNTFASPYLQNPLDQGADIVVHSATKYIAGHSDVVLGCTIVKDKELNDRLAFIQNSCGAVPGPQDCFLTLRGLKTLHVRMQRHCENGEKIARWLRANDKIATVNWCGFEDNPWYSVARRQMRGFGGMMSFTLKNDSIDAAKKVLSTTKLFSLAESLGGVESLIGHPASMTHASIPREERLKHGLSDSLIRLSVGIEDADDLIEDLNNAINA